MWGRFCTLAMFFIIRVFQDMSILQILPEVKRTLNITMPNTKLILKSIAPAVILIPILVKIVSSSIYVTIVHAHKSTPKWFFVSGMHQLRLMYPTWWHVKCVLYSRRRDKTGCSKNCRLGLNKKVWEFLSNCLLWLQEQRDVWNVQF